MISNDRYLSAHKWAMMLKNLPYKSPSSILGYSVLKQPIYAHRFGCGAIKVLLWSQMHGNESTTTRALFDFSHFTSASDLKKISILRTLSKSKY